MKENYCFLVEKTARALSQSCRRPALSGYIAGVANNGAAIDGLTGTQCAEHAHIYSGFIFIYFTYKTASPCGL